MNQAQTLTDLLVNYLEGFDKQSGKVFQKDFSDLTKHNSMIYTKLTGSLMLDFDYQYTFYQYS